jgi:hypothetical protein
MKAQWDKEGWLAAKPFASPRFCDLAMNDGLTLALTFYPLPRREEMSPVCFWFCERLSGKSRRANFRQTANGSLSLAHRMGEGGRRPGEGMSLAGMREVQITNFPAWTNDFMGRGSSHGGAGLISDWPGGTKGSARALACGFQRPRWKHRRVGRCSTRASNTTAGGGCAPQIAGTQAQRCKAARSSPLPAERMHTNDGSTE